MTGSSLLAVCFLVCTGLALDCEWKQIKSPEKFGLTFYGLEDRSCLDACCKQPDCDQVLVGSLGPGQPVCQQMNCAKENCNIQPRALLRVYKRMTNAAEQATTGGDKLLGSSVSRTNETNQIHCRQPMVIGHCRAAFPKYYYNVTTRSCRLFIYGGCGGNKNNFESQKDCEDTCSGVTGSVLPDESTAAPESPARVPRMDFSFDSKLNDAEGPVKSGRSAVLSPPPQNTEMPPAEFAEQCGVEPLVGPCRAAFQRWYYNSKSGSCESFIYGGCKGNKNNYQSKDSCMTTCTATVVPSAKKVATGDEHSTEYKDACMATSDPGPCRAAFRMFYYNPNTGTCQSFLYGGCRGNQNRYSTVEECMSRCSRDGSTDTRGKARDHWTPAIFLFITLAAISALLLAALVVITLRRHNLTRRPSSVSDKEELLPDPDEQSSVESLTLPESPKPAQG